MSSITGSCESPANLLFQQGLEKSQEIENLKELQLQRAAEAAANTPLIESTENAQSSSLQNSSQQGYKGLLIDVFV